MDIDHYLLKVNPPRITPYRKHSATLRIVAKVQAQRRLKGELQEEDLVADVIVYKHFIP